MKSVSSLPALLLAAVVCAAAPVAFAAAPVDPGDAQAKKGEAKPVQPHSHLQEKTGMMPQKRAAKDHPADKKADAPEQTDEQSKAEAVQTSAEKDKKKGSKMRADKDKSKHFHPRDGK
ncbi:hypothetical protein DVK02_16290 [Halobellus sp. Atlit-31R]|nr:hypothetical protein DVK02_16290 [Halobellus sp. Atlit-31R]